MSQVDHEQEQERLFTLSEAQAELALRECRQEGHDFQTIKVFGDSSPVQLSCVKCGSTWSVIPTDPEANEVTTSDSEFHRGFREGLRSAASSIRGAAEAIEGEADYDERINP